MTNNELYHHGILGQKWGVRRFQNPDGTLTNAGKVRAAKARVSEAENTYNKARKKSERYDTVTKPVAKVGRVKSKSESLKNDMYKKGSDLMKAESDLKNLKKSQATERKQQRVEREMDKYRTSTGELSSAGKARFREDGTKKNYKNMTEDEYDQMIAQRNREAALRTSSVGLTPSDAQRVAISTAATAGTVLLNEALGPGGKSKVEIGKAVALAAGTEAINSTANAAGAHVGRTNYNTSYNKNNSSSKNDTNSTANQKVEKSVVDSMKSTAVQKVGKPKNAGTKFAVEGETGNRWNKIMNESKDANAKAVYKHFREEGYSIDQIEEAKKELEHSGMKGVYIAHHGIKGQKWGVRRFQNPDGTLTAAGKAHVKVETQKATMNANKANANSKYKDFTKSYNKLYTQAYLHPISIYVKGSKNSAKMDELGKKAYKDLTSYEYARNGYSTAKKNYKSAVKEEKNAVKEAKKVEREEKKAYKKELRRMNQERADAYEEATENDPRMETARQYDKHANTIQSYRELLTKKDSLPSELARIPETGYRSEAKRLRENVHADAEKKTHEMMTSKYGEEKVGDMNKQAVKDGMAVAAALYGGTIAAALLISKL